jgi:hypothetical protein
MTKLTVNEKAEQIFNGLVAESYDAEAINGITDRIKDTHVFALDPSLNDDFYDGESCFGKPKWRNINYSACKTCSEENPDLFRTCGEVVDAKESAGVRR